MFDNKKGQLENYILIVIILFAFSMVMIFAYTMFSNLYSGFSNAPGMPDSAKNAMTTTLNQYSGSLDKSSIFLLVGIAIATLIGAALIMLHPVFIVFYIIGIMFMTFVTAVLSNTFQDMVASPQLQAAGIAMPVTSTIMGYLPLFVFFFGVIIGVVALKIRSVVAA